MPETRTGAQSYDSGGDSWSEVVKGSGKKGKTAEPPQVVVSAGEPNAAAAKAAGLLVQAPVVKALVTEFNQAADSTLKGKRAVLDSSSSLIDKKRANQSVGMDTEEKHVLL